MTTKTILVPTYFYHFANYFILFVKDEVKITSISQISASQHRLQQEELKAPWGVLASHPHSQAGT